jgi:LacI family transcriptional regulator
MNIYDIAKLSGVSIATVSRVINGSSKVSEKTRRKVLSVIEKADYTPNVFAQGLGLNTMHTIGILVPDIADIYMSNAVSILEKYLSEYGYDCILSCSTFEQAEKESHVRMLLSKHIDGLILVGSTYSGHGLDEHETDYIREAAEQVPVFIINGEVQGENVYSSVSEDRIAVKEAVSDLIQAGRKQILFLTESSSYSASEKKNGYEEALSIHGLPVSGDLKIMLRSADPHYVRDILLQYSKLTFDAAITTNDSIAVGVVKYANVRSLSIPEDIAIIGYNNSSLSVTCEPEITSIDGRSEQLCHDTVLNLISLLNGKNDIPKLLSIPSRLIKRNTTDF